MKYHSTYYGVDIYRQDTKGGFTGCRLPWVAGLRLAADTLAGIKRLIKEESVR